MQLHQLALEALQRPGWVDTVNDRKKRSITSSGLVLLHSRAVTTYNALYTYIVDVIRVVAAPPNRFADITSLRAGSSSCLLSALFAAEEVHQRSSVSH